MKSKPFILTGAIVAAIAMCGPVTAFAASKKASASPSSSPAASASPAASSSAKSGEKSARAIPFHGTVGSVDQSAKTFTIEGKTNSRTFKVTDDTKLMKGDATATFADIVANDKISGSYMKEADGSLVCKSVKVGGADSSSKSSGKKSKKEGASAETSASPSASPKK